MGVVVEPCAHRLAVWWWSGVSDMGKVANDVEVEQIVHEENGEPTALPTTPSALLQHLTPTTVGVYSRRTTGRVALGPVGEDLPPSV